MRKWDILQGATGKQATGVEETKVRDLVARGKLSEKDRLRPTGTERWASLAQVQKHFAQTPADGNGDKSSSAAHSRPTDEESTSIKTVAKSEEKKKPADDDSETHFRRSLEVDEFDLTPMVDMTFLLNMFFIMTTAYALLHSMQAAPPKPDDAAKSKAKAISTSDAQDQMIFVSIDAQNNIEVNSEKVAAENLSATLTKIIHDTGKGEVLVTTEPETLFETLIQVFDSSNEVGARVSLGRTAE